MPYKDLAKQKEYMRKYTIEYNRKNKDKRAAYSKLYIETHKKEIHDRNIRNSAHNKEYMQEYRRKNKDRRAAYNKAYGETHKEEQKEYARKYYIKNRDKRISQAKEYHAREPEKWKAYCHLWHKQNYDYSIARRAHLIKTYDTTPEEYDEIYVAQNGKCAICGKEETHRQPGKVASALAVDHDHVTGKIRGLLCQRCNSGIGFFYDDIELLKSAVGYLGRVKQ